MRYFFSSDIHAIYNSTKLYFYVKPLYEALCMGCGGVSAGEGGTSVLPCSLKITENNAKISPDPLRYILVLLKIILTVLPKSLKVIQLLSQLPKTFQARLPPAPRSQKPRQKITFWSCSRATQN